jgi:hypothetical protein
MRDDQTHHYVHWLNRPENLEIGLALCVKVNINGYWRQPTRNERSDQVKITHAIILYSNDLGDDAGRPNTIYCARSLTPSVGQVSLKR